MRKTHLLWPIATALAVGCTFLLLAYLGAVQAAHGERVFSQLDAAFGVLRQTGSALMATLNGHAMDVSKGITAVAMALAAIAVFSAPRRGAPLLLLAIAVSSASYGQALVLTDWVKLGGVLYGAGVLSAAALGAWYPITRLPGFPPLPLANVPLPVTPARPTNTVSIPRARSGLSIAGECVLVFFLALLALITRLYALNELPNTLDIELMLFTVMSRTLYGLSEFVRSAFSATSGGLFFLLPQTLFFSLFGSSIYSLRLAAVLWGIASVPLIYWFVRGIAGVAPAFVATLLFVAAPEQLFWSRSETTCYAPVIFLALVSLNLGVWMQRRWSLPGVVLNALWTPFCRFFYMPGIIMFLYPVTLFGHAVVFVRGAWRKAWYVVPILLTGMGLWFASLTVMHGLVDGSWSFVNPVLVSGTMPWNKQGELTAKSVPELVRLQAESMTHNLGLVVEALTYRMAFSNWYKRDDPSTHPTLLNTGFVVTALLGLGYLFGQIYERRAWAILLLVGLGLLPGILSTEPADRRIALVFPGLIVAATMMISATVRLAKACAGRVVVWATIAASSIAVAVITWTGAASIFMLPMGPIHVDQMNVFTRAIFAKSDVVYHNLVPNVALTVVFGNLERFISATPACYDFVGPHQWLDIALHPHCDFTGIEHSFTLPPARLEAIRRSAHPQRITFLSSHSPEAIGFLTLLQALYPDGEWAYFPSPYPNLELSAVTVSMSQIASRRAPWLMVGPDAAGSDHLETQLLSGVRLQRVPATDNNGPPADTYWVGGGLLLQDEGWYRFHLDPECTDVSLMIDGRTSNGTDFLPMASGIHQFEIRLANPNNCALPLRILQQRYEQPVASALPSESVVSPTVAAIPALRPPIIQTYAGYGKATPLIQVAPGETPMDFCVDRDGLVSVMVRGPEGLRVHRFASDGKALSSYAVAAPDGRRFIAMLPMADGQLLLLFHQMAVVIDATGVERATWPNPMIFTTAIGPWHDGEQMLSPVPHDNVLVLLDRHGKVVLEWRRFTGGPERFDEPVSVTTSDAGDILVIESAGQALLFHNQGETFAPTFVRQFKLDVSALPVRPTGVAFDGQTILVPDPNKGEVLTYNMDGERVMATDAARDLRNKHWAGISRFAVSHDHLYALSFDDTLWSVER